MESLECLVKENSGGISKEFFGAISKASYEIFRKRISREISKGTEIIEGMFEDFLKDCLEDFLKQSADEFLEEFL